MNDEARIGEILRDWLERRNRGVAETPEELLEAHQDLAEELLPRIEALKALDQDLEMDSRLPDEPLKEIGEYHIIREIGRGGMGVVYEAEQTSMGRKVALKVLAPAFTESAQAVERFRREAKASGSLHHTSIVQAHTMGKHKDYWYYTMELVEGGSLSQMIEKLRSEKPLTNNRRTYFLKVAELFTGVADALDAAHKAGIIHRDIKPGNLLLDSDESTLKIVDFGMARLDEAPSLTMSGDVLGTPIYMSPEQAQAKLSDIDHRTDIYSFGATLYEALTLRPPFRGKSALQIRSQIITSDPLQLRKVDPSIPRDLATIVFKAMEKDRDDRYQTAKEMARDLVRFVEGMPIHARSIGLVGRSWRKVKRNKVRASLVALILVLAVAGGFFAARSSSEANQRRHLEYNHLCALGQEEFGRSVSRVLDTEFNAHMSPEKTARDYFTEAIAYFPERSEAYWLRALAPGMPLEERLKDIDAAIMWGLSEESGKLLRAHLLAVNKESKNTLDARQAREVAASIRPVTALDFYAKARILSALERKEEALELLYSAIKRSGRASTIHYLARRYRATLLEKAGKLGEALMDLQALKDFGDERASVQRRIAFVWKKMGSEEAADQAFDETLRKMHKRGTVAEWIRLLNDCKKNEQLSWLDRTSKEVLSKYPEETKVLYTCALMYLRSRNYEKALSFCDRVLALDSEHHPPHEMRGYILHALEDYEGSLEAYDLAIEINSNCASAYYRRGVLLDDIFNQKERALEDFTKAEKEDPKWSAPHRAKGLVYINQGRFEEAMVSLDRALELDTLSPNDRANVHTLRGTVLERWREHEKARTAYDLAIKADPDRAQAYSRRGYLLKTHFVGEQDAALADFEKAIAASEKWIKLDPDHAKAHNELGIALRYKGDLEEALVAFQKAIDLKPNKADFHYNKGLVLQDQGNFKEAIKAHRKAIELNPEYAPAYNNLGISLGALGEVKDAMEAQVNAIRLDKDNAKYHFDLGMVLGENGDRKGGIAAFRKVIDLDPDNARAHLNLGVDLGALGNLEEAITEYRIVIKLDPDNALAHANLGLTLSALGKLEAAIAEYGKSIDLDPDCAFVHYILGNALKRQDKLEEAIASYRRAIDLDPNYVFAHHNLGIAFNIQGRIEEAMAAFSRAIDLDPNYALVYYNLGNLLTKQGNLEDASRNLQKSIELDPNFARSYHNLGFVLSNLGNLEEAAEKYRRAIDIDPGLHVALGNLVALLTELGEFDEAETELRKAIDLDPESVSLHGWLAEFLFERNKEAALVEYRKMMELDPGNLHAHVRTGEILGGQERNDDAIAAFKGALEIDPAHSHSYLWLGILYEEKGKRDKASKAYRKAFELAPDNSDTRSYAETALKKMEGAEKREYR